MAIRFSPCVRLDFRLVDDTVCFAIARCRGRFHETWSRVTRKERFAGQPFAVLAVNYGEADSRASEFLKRSALDLTVLLDPSQDASRAWRVRVLPASFLVGPDGRARYAVIGEIDWMSPAAVEAVRRLLP